MFKYTFKEAIDSRLRLMLLYSNLFPYTVYTDIPA